MRAKPGTTLVDPLVLRTVAIYLKGDTDQRVFVDQLGGPDDQAIATAKAILKTVAAKPDDLVCRVVARQPITDCVVVRPGTRV